MPAEIFDLTGQRAQLESLKRTLDIELPANDHDPMTTPTREEINAKLETIEVRLEGRVTAIATSIEGLVSSNKDTQESIKNLRSTMIWTAATTAIAIVLGVAAFNATVLSNMVASFESGKNTSAAQAEVKRQSEETAKLLRELEARMSQSSPNKAAVIGKP